MRATFKNLQKTEKKKTLKVKKMNLTRRIFCGRVSLFAASRRLFNTSTVRLGDDIKFKFEETESRAEVRLRKSDGVPSNFRLIYRAPMESYILMNQVLSSSSIIAATGFFTFKFIQAQVIGLSFYEVTKLQDTTPIELYTTIFISSLLISTTLWLSNSYPIRIYREEESDRFQYVKYGMIPFVKNRFQVQGTGFKHEPMNILPPGILYKDLQNKSRVVVFPQYFKTAGEMKRLTGKIPK